MIIKINEKRGVCPVFVWRGHVLGKHCNMPMNRIDASARQSGVRSGSESVHSQVTATDIEGGPSLVSRLLETMQGRRNIN